MASAFLRPSGKRSNLDSASSPRLSPASPDGGTDVQPGPSPPRLLERLRAEIRTRHYSVRTEATYVDWVRRFIHFHDWHTRTSR